MGGKALAVQPGLPWCTHLAIAVQLTQLTTGHVPAEYLSQPRTRQHDSTRGQSLVEPLPPAASAAVVLAVEALPLPPEAVAGQGEPLATEAANLGRAAEEVGEAIEEEQTIHPWQGVVVDVEMTAVAAVEVLRLPVSWVLAAMWLTAGQCAVGWRAVSVAGQPPSAALGKAAADSAGSASAATSVAVASAAASVAAAETAASAEAAAAVEVATAAVVVAVVAAAVAVAAVATVAVAAAVAVVAVAAAPEFVAVAVVVVVVVAAAVVVVVVAAAAVAVVVVVVVAVAAVVAVWPLTVLVLTFSLEEAVRSVLVAEVEARPFHLLSTTQVQWSSPPPGLGNRAEVGEQPS